jgi:hypothetical protein
LAFRSIILGKPSKHKKLGQFLTRILFCLILEKFGTPIDSSRNAALKRQNSNFSMGILEK